jgi:hypothetical protein
MHASNLHTSKCNVGSAGAEAYHADDWLHAAQVLAGAGVSEEELEAELQERLADAERMALQDEGVSAVLLLSAQAELGRMREAAAAAAPAAPPAAEVRLRAAVTHSAQSSCS